MLSAVRSRTPEPVDIYVSKFKRVLPPAGALFFHLCPLSFKFSNMLTVYYDHHQVSIQVVCSVLFAVGLLTQAAAR
jgi:hypothetical protein